MPCWPPWPGCCPGACGCTGSLRRAPCWPGTGAWFGNGPGSGHRGGAPRMPEVQASDCADASVLYDDAESLGRLRERQAPPPCSMRIYRQAAGPPANSEPATRRPANGRPTVSSQTTSERDRPVPPEGLKRWCWPVPGGMWQPSACETRAPARQLRFAGQACGSTERPGHPPPCLTPGARPRASTACQPQLAIAWQCRPPYLGYRERTKWPRPSIASRLPGANHAKQPTREPRKSPAVPGQIRSRPCG